MLAYVYIQPLLCSEGQWRGRGHGEEQRGRGGSAGGADRATAGEGGVGSERTEEPVPRHLPGEAESAEPAASEELKLQGRSLCFSDAAFHHAVDGAPGPLRDGQRGHQHAVVQELHRAAAAGLPHGKQEPIQGKLLQKFPPLMDEELH